MTRIDPEADPRGMAETLGLLRRTVTRALARLDGRLEVDFDDGHRLRVPGGSGYEPWQFTGPDGLLMVAGTDGELVIWS